MGFKTWTNAPKTIVDEDWIWRHRPISGTAAEDKEDPNFWEYRLEHRLVYQAEIAHAARFEADFLAFLGMGEEADLSLSVFHEGRGTVVTATYTGDWLVDNIEISFTKDKKCRVRVSSTRIRYDLYDWHERS